MIQTSYDIVKAHGGELKVSTNEGEGSELTISLPITGNLGSELFKGSQKNTISKT